MLLIGMILPYLFLGIVVARLCCSPFAESHRRSSRRKKVYFLVDCVLIPWNCLRYPCNISELH
uniref:Uncharacterized protein n=1 Tax=Populus trichocarpa TaxID=3694 RepID=A0A3N7G0D8_POPTR